MNSDKLNNIIKEKSKGNNNLAHHFHQMFFFEHVLMRLEKSKYRDNIILKGGVLRSSIIGEDLRTTAIREAYEETGIKLNSNDLILIDTLSGETRKNSYPNGDIVYNNTSLYLTDVNLEDASSLKGDSETKKLKFFYPEEVPNNLMDGDLIASYMSYLNS